MAGPGGANVRDGLGGIAASLAQSFFSVYSVAITLDIRWHHPKGEERCA